MNETYNNGKWYGKINNQVIFSKFPYYCAFNLLLNLTTLIPPNTKIPVTTQEPTTDISNCPKDTLLSPYDGKWCYLLVNLRLPWKDAELYCQESGGHLASIHNEIDNQFLSQYYYFNVDSPLARYTLFWIGGKKEVMDKVFVWSDNSSFDYINVVINNNTIQRELCLTMSAVADSESSFL